MTSFQRFALHVAFFATVFAFAAHLHAQTFTADTSSALPIEAQNFILSWLAGVAKSHAWVATFITILGTARFGAKPLFSVVHWIIDLTPSEGDNARFNRFLAWFHTPLGSKTAYLLDWVLSIKVIPPAKPAPVNVTPVT